MQSDAVAHHAPVVAFDDAFAADAGHAAQTQQRLDQVVAVLHLGVPVGPQLQPVVLDVTPLEAQTPQKALHGATRQQRLHQLVVLVAQRRSVAGVFVVVQDTLRHVFVPGLLIEALAEDFIILRRYQRQVSAQLAGHAFACRHNALGESARLQLEGELAPDGLEARVRSSNDGHGLVRRQHHVAEVIDGVAQVVVRAERAREAARRP
eukprot:ctg_1805.g525